MMAETLESKAGFASTGGIEEMTGEGDWPWQMYAWQKTNLHSFLEKQLFDRFGVTSEVIEEKTWVI